MKKIFLTLLIPFLAQGQEFGSFAVENTNFKQLFNNYRVASPDKIPWVGSWWAYKRNGTTYNGMYGDNSRQLGPTQKFDKFFRLGNKATNWEARNNTCDNQKDPKMKKSCQGWWGHCNAWAGAAIIEAEPRENFLSVSSTGEKIQMTVADQKAYLTELYMETNSSFVGKRVNAEGSDWVFNKRHPTAKTLKDPRYPGSATNYDVFWDVTPKQLFFIFTNYIGVRRVGLIIDRYTGSQVWNQPMAGYRILPIHQNDIQKPEIREGKKVYPVKVRMKMYWAEDGVGELEISKSFDINRTSDEFNYKEEYNKHYSGRSLAFYLFFDSQVRVSSDGKRVLSAGRIVGDGVWYHQTAEGAKSWKGVIENTHPDFIWLPNEIISKTKGRSRPPALTDERVRNLFSQKREIREQREKLENRVDNIRSLSRFKTLQKEILDFRKKGFISEANAVSMLINLKENSTIFARSPSDFLMLTKQGVSDPTSIYKLEMFKFISNNIDFFFSLNPNVTSILSLQKEMLNNSTKGTKTIDAIINLKARALSRINKPNLFIKTIDLGTNNPSKSYKRAMTAFLIGKIKNFMLLSPTVNDVLSYQGYLIELGADYKEIYELKERAIKNVSRYQDYVALLDLGTKDPPKAYRQLVFNLAKENPFINPDSEGLLNVEGNTSFKTFIKNHNLVITRFNYSYKDIMDHKRDGIKLMTRPDQMIGLISPRLNSVSVRYQAMIDDFVYKNIKKMISKTNPGVSDLMGLHKFIFSVESDMEIKKAALDVLKSQDELFKLLDPGKISPTEDYLESIDDFLKNNITYLREKSNPKINKWMRLTQFSKSKKSFLAIKEEGVNLVKGPKDLEFILGNGRVGNPNEELKKELESFLKKHITKMVGLANPTSEELVALTGFAHTIDGRIAIKKAGRDRVKSLEDFAYLLDPFVENPSEDYLKAIEDFKQEFPYKDEEGKIVDVTYLTCTYLLKTRVIKKKKGQFLGAAYDVALACNRAQEKCKENKKFNWKCHKEE